MARLGCFQCKDGAINGIHDRHCGSVGGADQLIEILGKITKRVGELGKLPPLSIPNRSVQLGFEEAHRCYLYGFRKPCMALCRATVDAPEAAGQRILGDDTSFLGHTATSKSQEAPKVICTVSLTKLVVQVTICCS
jgi:hypothetical protein